MIEMIKHNPTTVNHGRRPRDDDCSHTVDETAMVDYFISQEDRELEVLISSMPNQDLERDEKFGVATIEYSDDEDYDLLFKDIINLKEESKELNEMHIHTQHDLQDVNMSSD